MGVSSAARRFYRDVWARGELDLVQELCASDVRDHWHGLQGADAMRDVIAQLRGTFPDLTVHVERQLVDGDHVATHLRMAGTDRGGLFAMAPTGRRAEFTVIFIDRFRDGRIIEHWGVSDMMAVFRQLEVIPAAWQADQPLSCR